MPPAPSNHALPPNPLIAPFRSVLRTHRMIAFIYVEPGGLGGRRCGEVIVTPRDGAYVYLDDGCTDGEYTATIGHEIAHLADPHEQDETVIEGRAAAMLVPLHDAMTARTHDEIEAVARRHGVDPKLVRARVRGGVDLSHLRQRCG